MRFDVEQAAAAFEEAVREWEGFRTGTTASVEDWSATFEQFRARKAELVRAGEWVHGPSDLMHILGVEGLELHHSAVVAWLLEPQNRHGLGDAILRRILEEGWPERRPLRNTGLAVVNREVPLKDARADVVVRIGSTVLVIENKVRAPEHPEQCQNLYQKWVEHEPGADLRFLLLSLDGHAPKTTTTQDAADAWRSTSYRWLLNVLEQALGNAKGESVAASDGYLSARQYAATLRAFNQRHTSGQIQQGGGHVG